MNTKYLLTLFSVLITNTIFWGILLDGHPVWMLIIAPPVGVIILLLLRELGKKIGVDII